MKLYIVGAIFIGAFIYALVSNFGVREWVPKGKFWWQL